MKSISASDANRHFSALLRDVSRGARITVTSRGKPVAVISAANQADGRARLSAKRGLLKRLGSMPVQQVPGWSRNELYD